MPDFQFVHSTSERYPKSCPISTNRGLIFVEPKSCPDFSKSYHNFGEILTSNFESKLNNNVRVITCSMCEWMFLPLDVFASSTMWHTKPPLLVGWVNCLLGQFCSVSRIELLTWIARHVDELARQLDGNATSLLFCLCLSPFPLNCYKMCWNQCKSTRNSILNSFLIFTW